MHERQVWGSCVAESDHALNGWFVQSARLCKVRYLRIAAVRGQRSEGPVSALPSNIPRG